MPRNYLPIAQTNSPRKRKGIVSRARFHADTSFPVEISQEQIAFGLAVDRYKRERQRPHPTWPEILGVALNMGYAKTRSQTEVEFDRAMRAFIRRRKIPFPTFSEVLGVLASLGYQMPARAVSQSA